MTKYKFYHEYVKDIWPNEHHEGEVGIEVEVEGSNLPEDIPSYWDVKTDGSLRNGGLEYVLSKPIRRDNVLKFLQYLNKKFRDAEARLDMNTRTSVHAHINAADLTMLEVYVWVCLYLTVEDLLTEYAGPTRVGNLFCLRAKDSEYIIHRLRQSLIEENFHGLFDESRLKYAAINMCALAKFNSLEFRALRGTTDPDVISTWIELLLSLKDSSKLYGTPPEIVYDFSALGPDRFIKKIFPRHFEFFSTKQNLSQSLWEGIRLTQDVAHAVKWESPGLKPVSRVFAPVVSGHPRMPPRRQANRFSGGVELQRVQPTLNDFLSVDSPVERRWVYDTGLVRWRESADDDDLTNMVNVSREDAEISNQTQNRIDRRQLDIQIIRDAQQALAQALPVQTPNPVELPVRDWRQPIGQPTTLGFTRRRPR